MPDGYVDKVAWFRTGLRRQPWATALALLASYTGVIVALWAAALGLVLGAFVGAGLISSNSITKEIASSSGGISFLSVAGSALVSAVVAFAAVYTLVLFHNPLQTLISLVAGGLLTVGAVALITRYEDDLLVLRGYRRASRDEARLLAPAVQRVGQAMGLAAYPRFCIWDNALPGAWTHMRHIVLTTGLLQALEPDQLQAVIAHEMHHWRQGDSVSLRVVWAAGLPVSALYNLGCFLSGYQRPQGGAADKFKSPAREFLGFIGWFFLWPTWLIMKLLIEPATAGRGRQHEFEADAAAAEIGLAAPLIEALLRIALFESGRSGWEEVMTASHPPTELRVEALQSPRVDDADYEEGPLGRRFRGL